MSSLTIVLTALGLTAGPQQIAYLENLYLANLLSRERVEVSLNDLFPLEEKDNRAKQQHVRETLEKAGAFQEDPRKFNVEGLLSNLFAPPLFDDQDIVDSLTYWLQSAFARNPGQERCDLSQQPWMEKHAKQYLHNASILGLTDTKLPPQGSCYQETWILGGARHRVKKRLEFLRSLEKNGINLGVKRLLAGDRELSAPLDGENTMLLLAEKLAVPYAKETPFILKEGKKTTLNYLNNGKKLTEVDMVKDLY